MENYEKKLHSLVIQPDGPGNYLVSAKIQTNKNGNLLEINKVVVNSKDSQEIIEIINELVLILSTWDST